MASDSEVIKEFLVSVGFKLDQNTLGKFNGIMADVGKNVFLLASTLTAAATAIEGFVTIVADKMEDLYWSSQRLNSSVAQIQDYALGIENLGGSAAGAKASMEGLMKLLRTNPGYGGLLAQLGINPNSGATSIFEGLRGRFHQMPYFLAAQYSGRLGIDEGTLWAMMNAKGPVGGAAGGSGMFAGLYGAMGLDSTKAAKNAHEFMVQLRGMEAEFTVLAQVMAYRLLPFAKIFTAWMANFAENAIRAFASVDPKMWSALADAVSQLGTAFGALLPTMKETVSFLTTATKVLAQALTVTKDVLAGDFGKAATDAKPIGQWAQDTVVGIGEGLDRWISKVFSGDSNAQMRDAMAFFMSKGLKQDQAAAIVGNLKWESGMDFRKPGDYVNGKPTAYGYGQWHAGRQAMFAQQFGHDIHDSTPYEQLQFVWWELLHGDKGAQAAGRALRSRIGLGDMTRAFSSLYERPADPAASARQRVALATHLAGGNVNMNQSTNIHVNGAGQNASGIASEVARQQGRVNGDLLRNFKPVLMGGHVK
jgi:hypothetical protein